MSPSIRLSDVLAKGTRLEPHQAVAIVRALIDELVRPGHDSTPAETALTAEEVDVFPDATVKCRCAGTQSVDDVAELLDALLPQDHVSGALRYTISRAQQHVDAPPFASLEQFSTALLRFEKGERRDVLTALYAQAAPSTPVSTSPQPLLVDRRRKMPSATELRRQLREADRRLFEARLVREPPPVMREPSPVISPPPLALRSTSPTSHQLAAVGAALALGASFFVGYSVSIPQHERPTAVGSTGTVATAPPADDSGTDASPPPPSIEDGATSVLEDGTLLTRAVAGLSFSPAFARDGTTLFFQTGRSEDARSALMFLELPGGPAMPVVNDGAKNYHAQPSPDGTRIAFDSDREGERGVYISDRNGEHAQRVSGSGYAAMPTWSPDGKRLTFIRAEDNNPRAWNVWLVSLDTGEFRRVTEFTSGQTWASWFPDARRIAYSHEDRMTVVDVDRGRWRRYGSPIPGSPIRTPAVSPDGSQVIFQVAGSGAWLLDLESGSMRRALDDESAEEFAWSPDGGRVAFHSRRGGDWSIWIMAL